MGNNRQGRHGYQGHDEGHIYNQHQGHGYYQGRGYHGCDRDNSRNDAGHNRYESQVDSGHNEPDWDDLGRNGDRYQPPNIGHNRQIQDDRDHHQNQYNMYNDDEYSYAVKPATQLVTITGTGGEDSISVQKTGSASHSPPRKGNNVCSTCRGTGHGSADCGNMHMRSPSHLTCFICDGKGHVRSVCSSTQRSSSDDSSERHRNKRKVKDRKRQRGKNWMKTHYRYDSSTSEDSPKRERSSRYKRKTSKPDAKTHDKSKKERYGSSEPNSTDASSRKSSTERSN